MKLIKKIKTRSFHSRFQVKWRRRREGKTNYYSRKKLLLQDKQKYNVAKYRLVVRCSKKNILCQIIYSRLEGDFVISSSYSKNLPNIGLPLINNNYSTSYINGLYLSKKFFSLKILDSEIICPDNKDFGIISIKVLYFFFLLPINLISPKMGNSCSSILRDSLDSSNNEVFLPSPMVKDQQLSNRKGGNTRAKKKRFSAIVTESNIAKEEEVVKSVGNGKTDGDELE